MVVCDAALVMYIKHNYLFYDNSIFMSKSNYTISITIDSKRQQPPEHENWNYQYPFLLQNHRNILIFNV